jgi:hypothetical protein
MRQRETLTCSLLLLGRDSAPTVEWLRTSGLWDVDNGLEEGGTREFEVELLETPAAIAMDTPPRQVTRITSAGIVFYLCDVDSRSGSTLGRGDGWLIVPMSNVLSINFFGRKRSP